MTTAKLAQGTRTQLTGAGNAINSLASGAYVALGTITHNNASKTPLECLIELTVTPGAVAGNKQAVLFAQVSLDGAAFSSGPASGTTTTDEANLVYVGTLPLNSSGAQQRGVFPLSVPNGGVLPFATRLILKNDSGAAFSTSGNDVYSLDVSGDLT
ncbi:hypothetical protein [Massilia phyllosphaerae]|uniref:hypothetical protein n=1 Tax=Massilia phyllosphaerae TaxID=3106034 RepID=UPI002B1CDEDB|nr:hypothetical protein [Massilia sp. SGZ-792]